MSAHDSLGAKSFTVVVEADSIDGGYVVMVKELPGCASQGETVGEALRNIADAYEGVTAQSLVDEFLSFPGWKRAWLYFTGRAGMWLDA